MRLRLYLDSNIFIYTLEGYPDFDDVLKRLANDIVEGKAEAVTSEITLAEVLTQPIAKQDKITQRNYEEALQNSETFTVVPVARNVLIEAAQIRAFSNLKLPDAIHFATASLSQCTHFVTNDSHFKDYPNIKVLSLQQLRRLQK